jgi:hypothetical protein
MVFFFVAWGLLDDAEARSPWQTAGIGASILLIGAVVLRIVLMRNLQAPYIRQPSVRIADRNKLTVERAAAILAEINRKSDAANVLGRIASGHREVFEMCTAFIQRIESELPTVQPDSPRLATLLRSRTKATEIHRFHTLRWAELEARTLSNDAKQLPDAAGRVGAATRAIAVVEEALTAYPDDENLRESRLLLTELAVSVDVANTVIAAERAAAGGDIESARDLYEVALRRLDDESIQTSERQHAAGRIREALAMLSKV